MSAGWLLWLTGCAGSYVREAREWGQTVLPRAPAPDSAAVSALAVYGIPELDSLVAAALDGNLELQAAWARVRQADALAGIQGAALLPSVQAVLTASRDNAAGLGASAGGAAAAILGSGSEVRNRFQWNLGAAYEVDLWGRLRQERRAAVLDARAARADAAAMAVTLRSAIAATWAEAVAARRRLDILEAQREVSDGFTELTRARFVRGLATGLDVIQQSQQAESLRGRRSLARAREATATHQLAVLTGRGPEGPPEVKARQLPAPPPTPDTGLAGSLLLLRPDLGAALLRLEAADRRAAAAAVNFLPSLRLTAGLFAQAAEVADLVEDLFWSLSGSASQSLFQGGRLGAERRQARARAQEQVLRFKQALLVALAEVSDALVRVEAQREYAASLSAQLESARESLELARDRYRNGAADYLRVLTALGSVQELELALLDADLQGLEAHVQLHRALGSGWTQSGRITQVGETVD